MALMTSPTPGISAFPTADLTHWNATLLGPHALRLALLQAHPRLPGKLPLRPARSPLQDPDLSPQRRHERPHLPRHPEAGRTRQGGRVERGAEH
jgi:hypothetical protein